MSSTAPLLRLYIPRTAPSRIISTCQTACTSAPSSRTLLLQQWRKVTSTSVTSNGENGDDGDSNGKSSSKPVRPASQSTSHPTPSDSHDDAAVAAEVNPHNHLPTSRLNPQSSDYRNPPFSDHATITVHAGRGGNGCISFLRDLHFGGTSQGPPNGGNGGHGGSVYIAAVDGETSLHKLGRRRTVRAAPGLAGQGSSRDGSRGADVVITVPVGTVVREVWRHDPVADELMEARERKMKRRAERRKRAEAAAERAIRDLENAEKKKQREKEDGPETHSDTTANAASDEFATAAASDGVGGQTAGERAQTCEQAKEEAAAKARAAQEEKDWAEYEYPHYDKWVFYNAMSTTQRERIILPKLPRRPREQPQPPAPIVLDLSHPTDRPVLVAAGGLGGLGNPYFAARQSDRPPIATKGEPAVSVRLELELKLLADVGLVGLPNAGKSTLLRALTNSRARVENWAFTTLQPNIGTVVLDDYRRSSPIVVPRRRLPPRQPYTILGPDNASDASDRTPWQPPASTSPWETEHAAKADPQAAARTRFTVADIPGLIEGAHQDRGLGTAFLRHVERAGVLAFVVDLSAGPATAALRALWREVGLYALKRADEEAELARVRRERWNWDTGAGMGLNHGSGEWARDDNAAFTPGVDGGGAPLEKGVLHIAGKPWLVIATKADLPRTKDNFADLKRYLDDVTAGIEPHPSGISEGGWTEDVAAIPVSAINGHGMDRIVHWAAGLLYQ